MNTYASTHNFGFLGVTGKDASTFLQGYTTCDLSTLDDTRSSMGAICNIKGRMVTSFRIARHRDVLLLRMHRDLVAPTITFLSRYIVFSKAEMHDVSGEYQVVGVFGDSPVEGLDARNPEAVASSDTRLLLRVGPGRAELWVRDTPPVASLSPENWDLAEIESGLAWVTPVSTDQYLPQMFRYDEVAGVNFEKGCYLGQEVVARAHFRGKVKRSLERATAAGLVSPGATVRNGDRDVGQVVASAPDDHGNSIVLAVLPDTGDAQLVVERGAGSTALTLTPRPSVETT